MISANPKVFWDVQIMIHFLLPLMEPAQIHEASPTPVAPYSIPLMRVALKTSTAMKGFTVGATLILSENVAVWRRAKNELRLI